MIVHVMSLLEDLTLFVTQTYHSIAPTVILRPLYELGRPLNAPDPSSATNDLEGHRLICVNEVFRDSDDNQFRVIDVIGSGTYACVFKCQSVRDPRKFSALKVVKNLQNYKETGLNEISIHHCLAAAPNFPGKSLVMIPLSVFEIEDHICFIQPLFGRSLFEGLGHGFGLIGLLGRVRAVMDQLLQALEFIHQLGIVHADLKSDNVLFKDDDGDRICLIDFGSANSGARTPGEYIQSRFYRSPEIALALPWDTRVDVWSAGCIAAELFLDFAIFGCDTESDLVHSMVALLGPIPDVIIQGSPRWQRFFDMVPAGFRPKSDPTEVLLSSHCYHQVFETRGAYTLEDLVERHIPATDAEEAGLLRSFTDFLKMLLEYDPVTRVSAARARIHPFLLGQPLPGNWGGLREPSKILKTAWRPRRVLSMEPSSPDFLELF
jgi:dual specificity protein kinase YAK1